MPTKTLKEIHQGISANPAWRKKLLQSTQAELDAALSGFNSHGAQAVKTLKNPCATSEQTRIALANIRQIAKLSPAVAALKKRRDTLAVLVDTTPLPSLQHPGWTAPRKNDKQEARPDKAVLS